MEKFNLDDKNLVIICATLIAVISILMLADPVNVVMNIVTGMMGIATGQAMK
jgi:hypothetical protein